jgi:hypothetical protein
VISDHLFLFQTGFTGSLGFKRNLTALMCGEALMIEIKALEKLLG